MGLSTHILDTALGRPAAGVALVFIPAVGEYVIPELLGGPGAQLIGRVMWEEFFENRDWPMAAALAWLLLMVLVVLPVCARALVRAGRSRALHGEQIASDW